MKSKITKTTILVIIICLMLGMSQTALASGSLRTTAGVHLRSSASTTASSLMVVSANTSVEVHEHDPAGWSKVTVGSTTGFIRSDFLKLPTGSEGSFRTTAGVHLRSSASTSASSISVVSASTSVEVNEHDPAGWSKVTVGGNTGFIRSDFLKFTNTTSSPSGGSSGSPGTGDTTPPSGDIIGTLKTIGNVNLRSSASTTASIIRTLPLGTSVDVLSNENNWSRVTHNGTTGFIRSDLLTSGATSGATHTMRTNGNVNLRSAASTTSNIIRTIPSGTSVEVVSTESNWSKVIHNNTTGFIRADLLTAPAGAPPATQSLKTVGNVNLRSSASTSSSIIRTLPANTTVEVVSTENNWSRVTHNGTSGFIRADLLSASGAAAEAAIASVKTTGRINLRAGPSTTTTLLRTLEANTTVEILAHESSGWSRVRVGTTNGYIRSDLLSPTSNVEMLEWSEVRHLLPLRTNLRVVDVRTGIAFNIRVFSRSVHADVEPPTREDTDAILRSRNGVWSFSARPVWVTVGNRTFAASMNGQPHDVSTIADNGINGHFCLWFKGSASNTSNSVTYHRDMTNAIQEAYDKRPQ